MVVGHGTVLHPESGDTTRAVASALVGEGYREVLPAFMDQDPKLETVLAGVSGRVVVVPFFISEGWHAGMTIPRDLAGFELHYARAVGTHPGMAEVVLEIVEERLRLAEQATEAAGDHSDPLPCVMARTAFTRELAVPDFESKRLFQVEVRISVPPQRSFEVRNLQDWSGSGEGLRGIDAPDGGTSIALRSDSGAHRPLRSSPDLAGGWRFVSTDPQEVWRFLDRLYPGALVQRYLWDRGELPITTFREMAARQTGIHARVGELGEREVRALVEETCAPGRCLRTPVWQGTMPVGTPEGTDARPHDALNGRGSVAGNGSQEGPATPTFVPCPAPCSIFISAAARRVGPEG